MNRIPSGAAGTPLTRLVFLGTFRPLRALREIRSSFTPLATSNDVLAGLLSLCDAPDEYLAPERD
jgi:hypothetical protein